ncbi:hypothetical protein CWATWH8502_4858 [Crocosphaera watsonii WH 8502]|uniref:Uncharacterized protein n=5 Tax=Crocosphaera watsonii TaxID=263511 RepID=T2JZ27_CROWT|nr:hypothetical protein CWATWH0003_4997 [Crocosphaera watsonii WH 0003]CCQ52672.1 hypothetical protein CWATWH8502_4858 [Crocosphaera watsonii WH 8502]CCQ57755.1 hypothetical protein CWATWH0005_884 [Crocosphaera watsonii WH 0005]CCQ60282.1 hypothetical protein CWATWH0401_3136 [Crocosphaera watsonii WH 0401]CCQ69862.1 hypothetical protein CWATWH0402_1256 [Crocosphaera watsonii WH 0402]
MDKEIVAKAIKKNRSNIRLPWDKIAEKSDIFIAQSKLCDS